MTATRSAPAGTTRRRAVAATETADTAATPSIRSPAPILCTIAIDELIESPDNARSIFDAIALEALADTIRREGILNPLRVRELPTTPHVVCAGARRLRAARLAGLTHVPALLGPMTDGQYRAFMAIDNEQRENLSALEQAHEYASMMKDQSIRVADVATIIGKERRYVYDRLQLLKLIAPLQALFRGGFVPTEHAIVLARLTSTDQARALGDPKRQYDDGGLFETDNGEDSPTLNLAVEREAVPGRRLKVVSVRELQTWINDHVRFRPDVVDLPNLFPETADVLAAVPAGKVLHLTREHALKDDAKDPKTRTLGPKSWKRADGQYDSKPCEYARVGMIVAGPDRGLAFPVCINKEKCALHWKKERAASAKIAKVRKSGNELSVAQMREKQQREQERKEKENARWAKAAPALLAAVVTALKKEKTGGDSKIAQMAMRRVDQRMRKAFGKITSAADVLTVIAVDEVASCLFYGWNREGEVVAKLKPWGIDAVKIRDQVAPAEKATTTAAATGSSAKRRSITKKSKKAGRRG